MTIAVSAMESTLQMSSVRPFLLYIIRNALLEDEQGEIDAIQPPVTLDQNHAETP
jgi:hypothetical protein